MESLWCNICDREFGPGVERVKGRLRCRDCDAIDNAFYYVFHGSKKRNPTGRKHRGEAVGSAKLRESDIPAIRDAAASGSTTYSLAKHYRVSYSTIRSAVKRQTWKHVA